MSDTSPTTGRYPNASFQNQHQTDVQLVAVVAEQLHGVKFDRQLPQAARECLEKLNAILSALRISDESPVQVRSERN